MKKLAHTVVALAAMSWAGMGMTVPAHAAEPTASIRPPCRTPGLAVSTATDRPVYRRGQPVVISTLLTNVSSAPCGVDVQACVNATVTNDHGNLVWSAVPQNAVCAMYIVHETLAPGQSVSRSWTWDQHVCVLIGQCPGRSVGPGTYVAQGHWGAPYGDGGPVTFTIGKP